MRLFSWLIILFIIPIISLAAGRSNLRGERYCEVLLGQTPMKYAVYNTTGLNNCPQTIWSKITVAKVKHQTHAMFVHLNGPRYWVIDGIENSDLINPTIKTFSGLAMREAGILKISLLDLFNLKSYKKHAVKRHTTWKYEVDKPIYELIDANKNVFVMQSYSIQKIAQTQDSLANLGAKLHLPAGWMFKTGMLKQPENLTAINNVAIVVQDNFLNTYQQATHDFLP